MKALAYVIGFPDWEIGKEEIWHKKRGQKEDAFSFEKEDEKRTNRSK